MKIGRNISARIKLAWRTGFYDTMDLAKRFNLSEADIYNLIGRMKSPAGMSK